MQFYENYLLLCHKSKKSPTKVAEECGFSRMTAHRWKNGVMPSDKNLEKIASYFDITVAELTGAEQEENKKGPADEGEAARELSPAHEKLLDMAMGVNGEDLESILPIIQASIESVKKRKNNE